MNLYLLTFDPFGKNFSYTQLLAYIKDNRKVFQYYSPYAGTYFLKSSETPRSLQDSFHGFFEGSHFVVAKLSINETGGFLIPDAWNWMSAGNRPALPGD